MHYQTSAAAGEKGLPSGSGEPHSGCRLLFGPRSDSSPHGSQAAFWEFAVNVEEDDALNSLQVFEIGHRPFTYRCRYLCTPALTFEAVKPV